MKEELLCVSGPQQVISHEYLLPGRKRCRSLLVVVRPFKTTSSVWYFHLALTILNILFYFDIKILSPFIFLVTKIVPFCLIQQTKVSATPLKKSLQGFRCHSSLVFSYQSNIEYFWGLGIFLYFCTSPYLDCF